MYDEIRRNCNTCKFSMFDRCEVLRNNSEYQSIWAPQKFLHFKEAYKFKENFICDQYESQYIEYPIEVSKIIYDEDRYGLRNSQIGKFVKIAPCGKEYKNKTYLGLFLGDLPVNHHVTHNSESKELKVSFMTNPAIFVFDLNKIFYGMESWWGIIESEDDLKEITQLDIDNIWYVKALKTLSN